MGRPARRTHRTHRTQDKSGRFRWYARYRPPCGGPVTVRLHGHDEDRQRKLNRPEDVRPIPPTDPDFVTLSVQRNDAESTGPSTNTHLRTPSAR